MAVNTVVIIDAINIRAGGGITHLKNILHYMPRDVSDNTNVVVVCSKKTMEQIDIVSETITFVTNKFLERSLIGRLCIQQLYIPLLARRLSASSILSPGAIIPFFASVPRTSICQNMLPFELDRARLFGLLSALYYKMLVLRIVHSFSFKRAEKLIFLTEYAKSKVLKIIDRTDEHVIVIPHGIEKRFAYTSPCHDSNDRECVVTYTSVFLPYKHQLEVCKAFKRVIENYDYVKLVFVGDANTPYGKKVQNYVENDSALTKNVFFQGQLAFDEVHKAYENADALLFASSCENLPNILIEYMATNLPILCSNLGPMPETLGESDYYFNPMNVEDIGSVLLKFLETRKSGMDAWVKRKSSYQSWAECSKQTFNYLVSEQEKESDGDTR